MQIRNNSMKLSKITLLGVKWKLSSKTQLLISVATAQIKCWQLHWRNCASESFSPLTKILIENEFYKYKQNGRDVEGSYLTHILPFSSSVLQMLPKFIMFTWKHWTFLGRQRHHSMYHNKNFWAVKKASCKEGKRFLIAPLYEIA